MFLPASWSSSLLVLVLVAGSCRAHFRDLPGPYCATRPGESCCPGRDDTCTVPVLGTLCYCDMFCDRNSPDCCPDFRPVCLGEQLVAPEPLKTCVHEGKTYFHGSTVKINCNTCVCKDTHSDRVELVCDDQPCLIREKIIDGVNGGRFGWHASNHSAFWGLTLEEGVQQRLGTFKPDRLVQEMGGVDMNGERNGEESFDARDKWPQYVHPIRDQGQCGSSWAISTVDVAADRLAILSGGKEVFALSAQHLISCHNKRQRGCQGGYTDRAWRFLADHGVVTEECYPYSSGLTQSKGNCLVSEHHPQDGHCPSGRGNATLYKSPPPYRISASEKDIRIELKKNGPVQAVILVREDFYMYKSGVYRYSRLFPESPLSHRKAAHHSVRIIGWGVDRATGDKYWLCANSWGRSWGEDGYFRILRGRDESSVEMFVVGVWAKRPVDRNHL